MFKAKPNQPIKNNGGTNMTDVVMRSAEAEKEKVQLDTGPSAWVIVDVSRISDWHIGVEPLVATPAKTEDIFIVPPLKEVKVFENEDINIIQAKPEMTEPINTAPPAEVKSKRKESQK